MYTRSIRHNLLLWLLPPLLLLLAAVAVNAYFSSLKIANTVYDRALYDGVLTLGILVRSGDGKVSVDLPPVARKMLEVDPLDKIYYVVKSVDGATILGDSELPIQNVLAARGLDPVFYDSTHHGAPIRVAAARVLPVGDPLHPVVVAVAETLKKRQVMTGEILQQSVLPQLCFLSIAVLVVLLAIRRALQPLAQISAAVDRRSAQDFTPLATAAVPQEIRPLTTAFNKLMQRFEASFSLQQRFVANAAHQLRTPVAGMRAIVEAELMGKAEADKSPTLLRLHKSSLRMSRLVTQLLALSRAEPGDPVSQRPVALRPLLQAVIEEYQPLAASRQITLHPALEDGLTVCGDAAMLGEMVGNLLDNAIRYSPEGSTVSIHLRHRESSAQLLIDDEGPGIAEGEAERIFERFYRGEQATAGGSGLGLAIVKEIADAHGMAVRLGPRPDGPGTQAVVEMKLVEAASDQTRYAGRAAGN